MTEVSGDLQQNCDLSTVEHNDKKVIYCDIEHEDRQRDTRWCACGPEIEAGSLDDDTCDNHDNNRPCTSPSTSLENENEASGSSTLDNDWGALHEEVSCISTCSSG